MYHLPLKKFTTFTLHHRNKVKVELEVRVIRIAAKKIADCKLPFIGLIEFRKWEWLPMHSDSKFKGLKYSDSQDTKRSAWESNEDNVSLVSSFRCSSDIAVVMLKRRLISTDFNGADGAWDASSETINTASLLSFQKWDGRWAEFLPLY